MQLGIYFPCSYPQQNNLKFKEMGKISLGTEVLLMNKGKSCSKTFNPKNVSRLLFCQAMTSQRAEYINLFNHVSVHNSGKTRVHWDPLQKIFWRGLAHCSATLPPIQSLPVSSQSPPYLLFLPGTGNTGIQVAGSTLLLYCAE